MQYFSEKQCSPQWRAFLRAFATEFSLQGEAANLRLLMFRMGNKMAANYPLPHAASLPALQESMNRIWFDMDWGWVDLKEEHGYLSIQHHCSPLKQAFGESTIGWSAAILEGMYSCWFRSIIEDQGLRVQQCITSPNSDILSFRLERAL
jgi:hypothetical protein